MLNNIQAATFLILCTATLGTSWKFLLLDGENASNNSTRIKRQEKTCRLPQHPPNGLYAVVGTSQLYMPNSTADEYSSIELKCSDPYVTRSKNPKTLCIGGVWSPSLSDIEECIRPVTTTSTAAPNSKSSCFLPIHPENGEFSVVSSTEPYVPGAITPEFSSVRLSCLNTRVTERNTYQSLCIDGAWSPTLLSLGKCTEQRSTSKPVLITDCSLPSHPSKGEFRIIGSQNILYVPRAFVPEFSTLELTCKTSLVSSNNITRALCNQGFWYPSIGELGECVRVDEITTTTQPTTLEGSCTLPNHPINGNFKILGTEQYNYTPHSTVQQFTNIQLICSGEDGASSKIAICIEGKWSPEIADLGGCTQYEPSGTRSRNGCILPSNQLHGKYVTISDKTYDQIVLSCNPGYHPKYQSHFCLNGEWIPILEECIRTCPPLTTSETYVATCIRNKNYISCANALEGTEVDIKCNTFFEYTHTRPITKCEGGKWTQDVLPCVPECGKRRIPVSPLIIKGKLSKEGEFPWLVGIYLANHSQICGGSIISRSYVLSAAHCFTEYNDTLSTLNSINENDYLVAAGKLYRTLYDPRDKYRQITGIKHIYISEFYFGSARSYTYDYSILEVKVPFFLSEHVQLVCIDWESKYELDDFKENKTAVVSGWGYTMEGSSPSEELRKLSVHFKRRPSCNEFLPQDFSHRYYTEDKVCAGYLGQSVCQGDSGGGLYFERNQVYYVRGIVSLSPHSSVGCSVHHYALYTKVSKYLASITQTTRRIL